MTYHPQEEHGYGHFHVAHLNFRPLKISLKLERLEVDTSNFVHWFAM